MLQFCNLIFQMAVSSTRCNCSCLCEMQCALFTVIPRSLLVYTRLQMAISLEHGFGLTQNMPASIFVSTVIHKECFLNDKPLKWSNLILQWWNQWRNSKLCGSRSSSQRVKLQVTLLYSYRYFPHQTWNKPFEMVLLTPWVWNQNNRWNYTLN